MKNKFIKIKDNKFIKIKGNIDIGGYLVEGRLERSLSTLSQYLSCFFLLCKLYKSQSWTILDKNILTLLQIC